MKQIKNLVRPDEYAGELKGRYLLQRFWKSAAGFWGKRGTRLSWVLSGILLLIIFLNLATSYGMNVWTRVIFDALQKRDPDTILLLSMIYLPLLAASVFLGVVQVYARMTTQRRWREWLNNHLVDRWLKNGRYYQLNLASGAPRNPEYRLADDVRIATESPVDLVTGMTTAVLSAATFIVVLWTIGGALTVRHRWHDHSYSRLSRRRRIDLCSGGERFHGCHRTPLHRGVGEQEPSRGSVSLRAHSRARKRRKHRPPPGGSTRSAAASTSPSGWCCSRGEISAFRTCGPRLSPKPAAT